MRGAALLGSSLFFITGLRYLPIAEASATGFVAPLFVTALSIVFLSEKVGVRRWLATATGLLGVLIILRPGTGAFHVAAFFPIVSALAWAGDVDHDAHDERARARHHHHDLFVDRGCRDPVGAGAVRLGRAELAGHHVRRPDRRRLDRRAVDRGAGVPLRRRLACSRRSPTRSCVWVSTLGFLIFGEVPDAWTVVGAAFIVASGLYTAHRERVRRSQLLALEGESSPNP